MTYTQKESDGTIEIWGGIECTINRVGDNYLDQLQLGDYYNRPSDLDAILDLGIKTMRIPVLWERHQPNADTVIDWNFTESHLNKLKENNVSPIAGLMHHGSGPGYTDLLQEDFPDLLAAYAAKVAMRFPWINLYTPVNEPLTTARFSGLYGLWYPHKTNDVSFIKMLLNELKGIVLSMKEIRKVNPAAKLVQTEDLGKTYSTPLLSYQATFENHRRWLSYDILTGKFVKGHPLWNYFMRLGIDKKRLQFFIDNPCPPDIIGVNYYITSERYLDEHVKRYPRHTRGGNGLHQYADVEAIRVDIAESHGPEVLLKEIWERYRIPIAITEAHLHCSREEQLRWIQEIIKTSIKLKTENVEIIAVTIWSLLGSFGWNKLLTCLPCDYESGAFDISAGYARPTALAAYIKDIIHERKSKEHLLQLPGWWKCNSRFFIKKPKESSCISYAESQPVVIIGKNGTLGKAFAKVCTSRNIPHHLFSREDIDICNSMDVERMVDRFKPWAIINAAGYVKVDEAEREKDTCYRENTLGPQKLAIICERNGIKLMSFSSDLVFDGNKKEPYIETDAPNPLNIYGQSKMLAESFLANVNPSSLIIRTSAFFGPWDKYNFVSIVLSNLNAGRAITAADDIIISPTYVPHLVNASLDLLIDDATGLWHLANKGSLSWYEFARTAALRAGLNANMISPVSGTGTLAKRPSFSALTSIKYSLMPNLDDALQQYFLHKFAIV